MLRWRRENMKKFESKSVDRAPDSGDVGWMGDVLLALAHWMTYKSTQYRHWSPPEGAIAAEMWTLMMRFLPSSHWTVTPELPYKNLPGPQLGTSCQERADIAVGPLDAKNEGPGRDYLVAPRQVFELKRYVRGRGFRGIKEDTRKLSKALGEGGKEWKAFVVVVGNGHLEILDDWYPLKHIALVGAGRKAKKSKNRKAIRCCSCDAVIVRNGRVSRKLRRFELDGESFTYRARRVKVAGEVGKDERRSHWAALLEVVPEKTP